MRGRILILLIFLSCNYYKADATGYSYTYGEACAKAYKSFMALHLNEGSTIIRDELKREPNNLMAVYITDYEDCLWLLMNGDAASYEQRKSHFDERLDMLDKGEHNTPWYRVCKAGVYLHWAFVHLRMGSNFKAATMFRKSYLLIEENEKQYPGFAYNKIFTGLQLTLVGTIPSSYKWIASLFGMKGDVNKGINTLGAFVNTHNENDPLYEEALLYNLYMRYYLFSKQDEVWRYVSSNKFPIQDNLMRTFVRANISISYRKAETALQAMRSEENNRDYKLYPAFDFEMGCALYFKCDPACIGYFKSFLKKYTGGRFVKDTWQQMALMWYLQGDMKQANYCLDKIKTEGSEDVDVDKQAMHFAKSAKWPDAHLLQARMLIDGGYYEEALKKLTAINLQALKHTADEIEYYFRLGRAYDEKGDNTLALNNYQYTINKGKDRREYFAARAALQMGYVYERCGNNKEALKRYEEALGMRDHDFQSSIDQQAKAGINRLSVR